MQNVACCVVTFHALVEDVSTRLLYSASLIFYTLNRNVTCKAVCHIVLSIVIGMHPDELLPVGNNEVVKLCKTYTIYFCSIGQAFSVFTHQ